MPVGVAVNEAVTLAKKYDGDDAGTFVNGILRAFLRNREQPEPVEAPQEAPGAMTVLGFDTSNYTTSIAAFDGTSGENQSRLLPVKAGELGLRRGRLVCPCEKPAGSCRRAVFPCGSPVCGGCGSQHPAAGGGWVLYALFSGRSVPGQDGGLPPPGSLGGGLSPTGASGCGPVVFGPGGAVGQALSGLAPLRRHHGAAVRRAPGAERGLQPGSAAPQTFLPGQLIDRDRPAFGTAVPGGKALTS